ncbi:zinc-dependent alcohol dehydrogenase family protein [Oscillatoria sp. FACHB-1407]|uniref:zinc-dependent alcohol dehydrogenase family protein n=1 Tax=Oscillatoria sp. FACHB-1407 TaxID=2692847 RepID=UPI0016874C15|nr:zinc-dependent alcohol dehydrogenase family protein [Oscillatoria sp. FACHB-1407]MBD2465702.1 zinc-dependent alcohol dehydrogenase family protein [Oscillatoria sp. FACHB-1407]
MPKIVRFYEFGSADVLKLKDESLKEPSVGEVRLKVEAIGLNRAEVGFRSGRYLELPETFPSTLGYEASGIIDAIGEGVMGFQIGDRVSTIPAFSMKQYGVYGESAIVPATAVAAYPESLSPQQGTAIWMQYITAYGPLVEYGQVKAGDFVLITAASSSVGYSAIQIAKAAGAVAIATTRSTAKKQMLLENGADHVIVTNDEDLVSRVMEITNGHGADLIFDAIAGSLLETLATAAAPGATIFVYGALDETASTSFPLFAALQKGLKVQGYTLFEITTNPEKLDRAKQYIYDGLTSGALVPVLDRVFSLEQIVEAHQYMESNQQNGKIIVTVP